MSAPPAAAAPTLPPGGADPRPSTVEGNRMRKTYEATRMFTLSTFSPTVNLGPGQPIVFDHMEFMGAEQREEVAAAVGTGALAPIQRDRDEESLAAYPEPLHTYDRDDDGLDWREMFRRYAEHVHVEEAEHYLRSFDWSPDEWAAIQTLGLHIDELGG